MGWSLVGNIRGPKGDAADLAPATASTLGGVKVGDGLDVAADGTLSAAGGETMTDDEFVAYVIAGTPGDMRADTATGGD